MCIRDSDTVDGLEVGRNASDLTGCFSLSNSVEVIRENASGCQAIGGELFGGPFEFCSGDGAADTIAVGTITLANTQGMNSQWVVTDEQGVILGLPPVPSAVNFDDAPAGNCFVWHLAYEDGIEGLEVDMNANDLQGCFSLSNSIEVVRVDAGPLCFTSTSDDFGSVTSINVFPNPANEAITVSYEGLDTDNGTLQLVNITGQVLNTCLLYTSPSPRDATLSRMPSSA